jgi:DNA ligase D-like protein (predicted 3'-phosphoesterase)
MAIFVIQKHNASHLHYDFRFSLNKVLKSWAIPKLPPKTKGIKRLAVQTDDHALSYAKFEGEITEGYGKGTVEIWDKGKCKVVKKEKDKYVLNLEGNKLKGEYCLIKFKKSSSPKNWLFFKV